MPIYEIQRNGKTYEVEAPDPQLAAAAVDPTKATAFVDKRNVEAGVKPFQPGPLEKVGRYLADWGQGMRDAFSAPGEEGTVVGNVTAPAAGIVDAGLSVAGSIPASLIGINELSRARMAGDTTTEYADLVEQNNPYGAPKTQTGQAYMNAAGAVIKPVGDLFNLAGSGAARVAGALGAGERAQEDIRAVVPDALGTVLDVVGAAGAGKATSAARSGLRTVAADSPVVRDLGRARAGAEAIDPATANLVPGETRAAPIDATPTSGEVYNPRKFGGAVEDARRLDYPLMPSQVAAKVQDLADVGQLGRRVPGTIRERFTSPAFEVQFAKDSQKVTNRLAAKDIGMDGVTPVSLANAKAPHIAVYNEVVDALPVLRPDSELGAAADAIGEARRTNPLLKTTGAVEEVRDRLLMMENIPTQKALDAIRTYRRDAAKYYRQADLGQGDIVAAEQAGDAYRAAADALEQAIDRQSSTLNPGLLERMQYARQQLAKIHNVEDAFDGFNVDPQLIASMAKRFPLTGYLAEIAKVAQQFPDTNYLTTGAKYPKSSLVGALDSVSLAIRKATGQETQNPSLLSRSFQNRYGEADPNYDPRPAPPTPAASPIVDYTPPDPNLPGGAAVGPPTQGGGGGLAATNLADDFEILQPAEMRVGDLTAETPPMGGSLPADTLPPVPDELAGALGLEVPPRRFTAAEEGVLDEGLPFELDPEMASASIVRGGPEPGPVADTELLAQELLGAELRGRPLDPETGAGIAPEGVDRPFTRPAAGLGEDLGTDFGAPPRDPLLEDMEARGREGDFEPGVGPRPQPGFDPYADAVDAEIVGTRRPDAGAARPLPPPDDLAGELVGPMSEEDAFWTQYSRDPAAAQGDLELAPDMPPPDDIRARYREDGRTIPPGARIIEAETKDGYIAARPTEDGAWQIRSAFTKEGSRGKGIGKSNLMKLTREVADEGGVLHSDSKISEGQVGVYRSLRDSGQLEFDGDLDAITRAMDETGNATNPNGEPWIRNIRLGPAG